MAAHPPARYAVLSDVHANIDALEAVLADIKRWHVDVVFCLGDIIGYGPAPADCVQRIADLCKTTVFGNHEVFFFLAEKISVSKWGAHIGTPIQLALEQLSKAQAQWLHSLPLTFASQEITLSHASLNRPELFRYIFSLEEAEAHFALQDTFVSLQGHTHVPLIWQQDIKTLATARFAPSEKGVTLREGKRYAINVGSVGQPRDGDPMACYALYDARKRLLVHRRVPYDIAKAQERFKKADLPSLNYSRLARGE